MRFANDKEKYTEFLDILKMYRTGQKNINETFDEVMMVLVVSWLPVREDGPDIGGGLVPLFL